jgi:hypothetical protein
MALSPAIIDWCKQEALGQVLTSWGDLTYEDVIESLEGDEQSYPSHEDILVWQPFEGQWAEFLVDQIESLYSSYVKCAEFTQLN